MSTLNRIYGLDFLRALAILGVLLIHFPRSEDQIALRAIGHFGWTGVDLFFVLSGYLISYFFFKDYLKSGRAEIRKFYVRRLFKTLPNYYVLLLLFAGYFYFFETIPEGAWKYLFLIQNFHNPPFFAISWSLCIEEHFYLFYPLIAGWILLKKPSSRAVILGLAGFVTLVMVTRALIWWNLRPDLLYAENPDRGHELHLTYLYWPSYARFDEFVPGILVALIHAFRSDLWNRMQARSHWFLAGGLVLVALGAAISYRRLGFLATFVGYDLFAFGFAGFLIHALNPKSFFSRWQIPGVRMLAKYSYALYLSHPMSLGLKTIVDNYFGWDPHGFSGALTSLGSFALLACVLFSVVEKPFMKWRGRFL